MSDLLLHRPGSCFVEPVHNSGLTDSGIYVYDHDNTKDMNGVDATINYRVLETYKCAELRPGGVYVVQNPYNYSIIDHDGKRYYEMLESNFICELEGYDDHATFLQQQIEDEPDRYPVCTK